ncbi:MAG: ADP-forming succinate--CoA ligase subunit beta [Planctomycetota bacterium]
MNIHEYQARDFFRSAGIPCQDGRVVSGVSEAVQAGEALGYPVVVKAQVHVGGRGKAGGVKLAKNRAELEAHAKAIIGMTIKGYKVAKVLVVKAADIKKEFYVSVTLDRAAQRLMFVVSKEGGMDIEEVAATKPKKIKMVGVDPLEGLSDYKAREVASHLFTDAAHIREASSIFKKLYTMSVEGDLSLVEINPFIINSKNTLEALDGKISLDDNAIDRHSDYPALQDKSMEDANEIKAKEANLAYVSLDGDIGCLVNGAGLAMATLDVVKKYGGQPANFLDIGGSSNPKKVVAALEIIMSNPKVKAILFNIFGGITRCDDVANGLIEALKQIKINIPIVIRLTGTNEQKAREILSKTSLITAATMEEAIKKVVSAAMVAKA